MRIPLLRTQRLRDLWDHQLPDGWIVWKLLADPAGQRLVIEERDPQQFQARLCAIDVRSGSPLWRRDSPIDPWWTNLTALSHNRAILEGYASRDLPLPKGIAILDLNTGEQVWADPDSQLVEVRAASMKLRSNQYGIERIHWRSIDDGAEAQEDASLPETIAAYPVDAAATELPKNIDRRNVAGPIERVTTGDYDVFAFYAENERDPHNLMQKTFKCHLEVMKDGRQVLQETLAAASPFPVAGNFIVLHDILIYVQEKTRLVAVHLA